MNGEITIRANYPRQSWGQTWCVNGFSCCCSLFAGESFGSECSMAVVFHLNPPPDFLGCFSTVWKKSAIIQRKGGLGCQLPFSYVQNTIKLSWWSGPDWVQSVICKTEGQYQMSNEDLSLDSFCGPFALKRLMQCVSVWYQYVSLARSFISPWAVARGWDALTQLGWLEEKLHLLGWGRLFLFCIAPSLSTMPIMPQGRHTPPWVSQQVLVWFILLCKCYLYRTHIHEKNASSVTKYRTLLECALMLW